MSRHFILLISFAMIFMHFNFRSMIMEWNNDFSFGIAWMLCFFFTLLYFILLCERSMILVFDLSNHQLSATNFEISGVHTKFPPSWMINDIIPESCGAARN
jgi:hypothetical protein